MKVKQMLFCVLILILINTMELQATPISSRGGVQALTQISDGLNISVSDLYVLENEIILLEQQYKETLVTTINNLDKDDVLDDIVVLNDDSSYKDYATICETIFKTQSIVDTGEIVYKDKYGALTTDTKETKVVVGGATANNLSVGTRAWVDGHYIEGNGLDNKAYYDKGYQAGLDYANSAYKVEYTYHTHGDGYCNQTPKYHVHSGNTTVGGTCYATPIKHVHTGSSNKSGGCYTKPVYHQHVGNSSTNGGCYTTPVYHQHKDSCYGEKDNSIVSYTEFEHGRIDCTVCGGGTAHERWHGATLADGRTGYLTRCMRCSTYYLGGVNIGTSLGKYNALICKIPDTHIDSYGLICGKTTSTIESYDLNCGKTTESIDSYALSCKKTSSTIDSYYCSVNVGTITSATVKFY